MNWAAVSAVLAGLADDVDDGLLELGRDQIHHGLDLVGIDIVQHEHLRPLPRPIAHQVVGVRVERILKGRVAQGAAADPQHDQHIASVAEMLHLAIHGIEDVVVVRQVAVAQLSGLAIVGHLLADRLDSRGKLLQTPCR